MDYPVGEHKGWEDAYGATLYATFDELIAHAKGSWLGQGSSLNWPVWVEYDSDDEMEMGFPTVAVGLFMPRKGYAWQHIAPATPEQAQELRRVLMDVWTQRADAQFRRYTHEVHRIAV